MANEVLPLTEGGKVLDAVGFRNWDLHATLAGGPPFRKE